MKISKFNKVGNIGPIFYQHNGETLTQKPRCKSTKIHMELREYIIGKVTNADANEVENVLNRTAIQTLLVPNNEMPIYHQKLNDNFKCNFN